MQSKQNIKQPALLASQYCKHEKIQEFKKLENVFHIFPDGLSQTYALTNNLTCAS